ncbi:hypothetical protein [Streptomyces hirsutus]|uniref:hypothetical protein n=1 Tax=Streptomyces hirsutus TaxID=35620 RepID=UPI0036A56703
MNATLRRIAVSTTATVALLGGATATADASPEHEATVLAVARTDTQPGSGDGIGRDLAPNGVGAPLQNPNVGQVPAGYPQQIQTQAGGAAIGGGVVAILVLGGWMIVRIRSKDIKVGDAVLVTLFGIAVSGTVIGALGDQLTDSAIASLGSMLGGL